MNNPTTDIQTDMPTISHRPSKNAAWWFWTLSSLPFLTALLSFRPDGEFALWQQIARQFWLPSQIFEVATICFALSLGCSWQKEWTAYGSMVKLLSSLWMVAMLLATVMSDMPSIAVLSQVSWMIHAFFAVSILFLLRRFGNAGNDNWSVKFSSTMPLGSAAFVALTGIFFAVVGIGSTYDWVSSLPGFTHIRHSGYFLMPAIALSTGMIAVSTGKRRNLHVLLLAINFGFAIWTGSRGPIMIFIVMIALALILFAIMRNIRTVGTIALALGAGTLLSQLVPAPNHSAFNALSRFEGNHAQSADKLSSGRTEIWRDTLRGIAQQPVIGHGGSQFRIQVAAAKKTYNHPHDSILQFAYEWGLVGAAALLALLGLLGQKLLKLAVSNPERHLPLFLATISISMFSLIDGLFYYNLPIMLFLTCAFLMITHAEANAGK